MAARDERLRPLADAFRGAKPPRFPSLFEALVNAVACQQLSLEVGLTLLNRLTTISNIGCDGSCAFPTADDVARLSSSQFLEIGFSRQKTRALLGIATGIAEGRLKLETIASETDSVARQRLLELRGIGRWTAEYVLLRGLGRLEVFPGDDVGAQKRLAQWLGQSRELDYAGVAQTVARWHPYAGLVYFHLLLHGLRRAGVLSDLSGGHLS